MIADREYLKEQIGQIEGLHLFPSNANFVYVRLDEDIDGDSLRDRLLVYQGCFVRNCGNKIAGTKQYFRIAARPKEEVDFLMNGLREEMAAMMREQTLAVAA